MIERQKRKSTSFSCRHKNVVLTQINIRSFARNFRETFMIIL